MEYETLAVEKRGHVGWLSFNRPDSLNAFNLLMSDELSRAWSELDEDDEVRVIVNTGRGRAFQTGVDVKEVSAAGGMGERNRGREGEGSKGGMTARSNNVWKPVICAVNGICAGGGFHFVVDADVVVASSTATFVDPHTSVGQVSALEPIGLVGRIPFEAIMRLVLMGRHERLSSERARELGLVSQIFEAENFEAEVQDLAETIASNSPSTMMASKKAIWGALERSREAAMAYGLEMVRDFWDHPDNLEGARAFAEKREATWASPRAPGI